MDPQARSRRAAVKRQASGAAARAAICGYVDAYTLLTFGVYASFMTGNTTSAAVRAGEKQFSMSGHNLLPIPFFLLGILGATLVAHADERRAMRRLSALGGAMLLANVAAMYLHGPQWISIAILTSAMGVVNTSLTNVGGQPVSLGFMTGDLNSVAKELAEGIEGAEGIEDDEGTSRQGARKPWYTPWRRAAVLAALWLAFLCGALLGAVLAPHCLLWTLVFPAAALLGLSWLDRAGATN